MSAVQEILEKLEKLTLLEASELVKAIEEKFDVSATPSVAAVAAGPAAGAGAEAEEEKTEFDVVLKEVGGQKLQVIKEVRALLGLGLKEAKEVVDKAPGNVAEGIDKNKANEIKDKLEAVGAKIEIK